MQRLYAIAWLTWKAAFRFRLFLVVAVLLLISVVGLPLLIKDDGTARGFTQILLTYTLTAISALLGLSTLWLACGTLARDIEECQVQLLAVKPIPRWQIWLGKWLGIMSLNALLLVLSAGSVYGLLRWRAAQLPPKEQQVLRDEVLVARGSARERSFDREIDERTDRLLRERREKNPVAGADPVEVRKQIREQVKAALQIVLPGYQSRPWTIGLGLARHHLRGQPLFLRVKFNVADKSPTDTYDGVFRFGVPQKTQLWRKNVLSMAPDTFHEFEIPPDLFDQDGVLTITFGNANDTALLFPLEDGVEILYREGGFGLNFARGVGIIFCWMGLLAALGLASASLLSFPVAAFFSLGVLTMALASGTLANAVEQGTVAGYNPEKGTQGWSPLDVVAIPAFKGTLYAIHLATQTASIPAWLENVLPGGLLQSLRQVFPNPPRPFLPVDALSTGRTIPLRHLGLAAAQIVLFWGGILATTGIFIFSRRELATAQGTQ